MNMEIKSVCERKREERMNSSLRLEIKREMAKKGTRAADWPEQNRVVKESFRWVDR